ncbi:hypothetical protein [Aeromonas bestiarum]|uniref:hypothetical protein n=1 Tax=Aeromonas bestiarum TaxID=105751 RepID=UPI0005015AB8|nr:hypothetical protein [Aeromonas bestiarum]KFN19253.1 hypothetical protein JM66_10905 [Aeromonas bestiarum]
MSAITKALIGEDSSKELQDECSAHLDTLMALGQAKSLFYAEKIKTSLLGAGQGTDRTFPITTIQSFIYQTKAYTADNAKNISDVVNDSIKNFVAGDNAKAVTTMISGFVDILFGSSEGSECEIIRYCAILEGATMTRLDFAGWSRSVTSKSLKNKCDKVSAFVLYRSIVDMKKVSFNDFMSIYQYTVKAENPDIDTAGIVRKCQELYNVFNPEKNSALKAARKSEWVEIYQPSKGYDSFDVFTKDLVIL